MYDEILQHPEWPLDPVKVILNYTNWKLERMKLEREDDEDDD
jgi:hypothetical protein